MNKKLTELQERYIRHMQSQISTGDTEVQHSNADKLLCKLLIELGFDKLVEIYNQVEKWYA